MITSSSRVTFGQLFQVIYCIRATKLCFRFWVNMMQCRVCCVRPERFRISPGLVHSVCAHLSLFTTRSAVVRGCHRSLGDARSQSYQTVWCQRSRRTTRDARRQVRLLYIYFLLL